MRTILTLLLACSLLLVACNAAPAAPDEAPEQSQQQNALPANSFALVARDDSVSVGDTVTVDLVATDVADVFGVEISVAYDPAILTFTSANQGTFLSNSGSDDIFKIDPKTEPGLVKDFVLVKTTGTSGSGSGVIGTYTFTATAAGSSALSFADVLVANQDSEVVTIDLVGDEITVH